MRIRILLGSVLVAIIMVLATPATTSALPNGMYIITCKDGVLTMRNIIGNVVATGICWCQDTIYKVVIHDRIANPEPPTQYPEGDPVWAELSPQQWVDNISGLTPVEDGAIEPWDTEGEYPTLTCNEAHFD